MASDFTCSVTMVQDQGSIHIEQLRCVEASNVSVTRRTVEVARVTFPPEKLHLIDINAKRRFLIGKYHDDKEKIRSELRGIFSNIGGGRAVEALAMPDFQDVTVIVGGIYFTKSIDDRVWPQTGESTKQGDGFVWYKPNPDQQGHILSEQQGNNFTSGGYLLLNFQGNVSLVRVRDIRPPAPISAYAVECLPQEKPTAYQPQCKKNQSGTWIPMSCEALPVNLSTVTALQAVSCDSQGTARSRLRCDNNGATKEGCNFNSYRLIIQSNMILVANGQEDKNPDTNRRAVAALSAQQDGKLALVVAAEPGKPSKGAGLTYKEFGALLARFGSLQAINLDGGPSAQFAVRKKDCQNTPSPASCVENLTRHSDNPNLMPQLFSVSQ